jgi:hypothetical protein
VLSALRLIRSFTYFFPNILISSYLTAVTFSQGTRSFGRFLGASGGLRRKSRDARYLPPSPGLCRAAAGID